jgi:Holliday junction resolvase RusA-like endonuclease
VVTFEVPGDPHGKGRPKFARRGNFVQTYTDKKTTSYEDLVRFHANIAMVDLAPLESAVAVYIYIKLAVPKSYSKKRTEACLSGLERPIKKPDWDNVAKSICDAINGIVYIDDTQIVDAHVTKVYAANAGVDVGIKEIQ